MNLKDLRAAAKLAGIKGFSRMSKAELEAILPPATTVPLFQPTPGLDGVLASLASDQDVSRLLASVSKGEARKIRKQLHANGMRRWAALRAA